MTFTYNIAEKISNHYKFLIGEFLDNSNSLKITNIYIFPTDKSQHRQFFMTHRFYDGDNKKHLYEFGANLNMVEILLFYFDEPIFIPKELVLS